MQAHVATSMDGEGPEVTELETVLLCCQTFLTGDGDGASVEVERRRDDGPATTAMVVLDRAGSLQAVEAVEGLAADAFGASGQSLFGSAPLALPKGRLAAGERWTLGDDERRTTGRLERFGVIDGEKVAVVRSTASDDGQEAVGASGANAALDGAVSATSTTSYDLSDGAIRQSRTSDRKSTRL